MERKGITRKGKQYGSFFFFNLFQSKRERKRLLLLPKLTKNNQRVYLIEKPVNLYHSEKHTWQSKTASHNPYIILTNSRAQVEHLQGIITLLQNHMH